MSPSKQPHRQRKTQERATRLALVESRLAQQTAQQAALEAAKREAAEAMYLPGAGENRPAQLWTHGRLHLPQHQDTTATLAGAYPFLAEGGLGADGVFIGSDLYGGASFVYDPWVLYQAGIITAPNIVLAGIVGSGKSSLAKSLYTLSIPFGRRVYVPDDPKGEHTAVAETVGWKAIRLEHGLSTRLNPLDSNSSATHTSNNSPSTQKTRRTSLNAFSTSQVQTSNLWSG